MAVIKNATFETNLDNHQEWFGCTVARSNTDAHGGTWSLLGTSSGAFGSGISLDNFPYYSGIVAGQDYAFSVWYKEAVATMPTTEWRISWYDSATALIGSHITINLSRATSWTQVSNTLTAPAGAVTVGWTFFFSVATVGPAIRIDDILVQDAGLVETSGTAVIGITALATPTKIATSSGRGAVGIASTAKPIKNVATKAVCGIGLGATLVRLQPFLRGALVGDRNITNGALITDDGGTYRLKQTARISVSALELVFGNWSCAVDGVGDVDGPNAYTINSCYIEHNAALTQVTFDGATSVSIDPGNTARGAATVTIAEGDVYYIRSYVTPDTVGGSYPRLKLATVDFPGEMSRKSADHANEVGTTNLTDYGTVFGPCAVTGTHTGGALRGVAVVGDSIAWGSNDSFSTTSNVGFIYRALVGQRPFLLFALPGEAAYRFLATQGTQRERYLGPAAQYLICEHGINDLQSSRTLAQIKAALIEIWTDAKARNPSLRIIQTTITPKSASTDSWATVVNQTPDGTVHPVRPTLNVWIRAGAPMIDGVGVTPGTPGEITAGAPGHPLYTYFEISDLVESARDSGLWKAGYTADGVHPNVTGHIAMVPGVDLAVLGGPVLTSGTATAGVTPTVSARKAAVVAAVAPLGVHSRASPVKAAVTPWPPRAGTVTVTGVATSTVSVTGVATATVTIT